MITKKKSDEEEAVVTSTPSSGKKPIEELAAQLGTPLWLFRAAKIQHGWAIGAEVDEKTYQDAVHITAHGRIG
jgi:hypothetical protein